MFARACLRAARVHVDGDASSSSVRRAWRARLGGIASSRAGERRRGAVGLVVVNNAGAASSFLHK